ncbi:MAG TPA: BON domain-containing protein [Chitinophagaceae bacterium]
MKIIKILAICMIGWFCLAVIPSCKPKDSDIQSSIAKKLPAGITATVQNGVVTLNGQCPDENCKTTAEQATKDVKGVKSVENNISVSIVGNEPVVISGDEALTTSVNSIISAYPGVKAEVKDGVVTLTGNIKRTDLQVLMQKLNETMPKKIENKLVIN